MRCSRRASKTPRLTNISPDGKKFVVAKSDGLPPISRLGCPCVHLAEMMFDPIARRARDLWVRSADGFDLFYFAAQAPSAIQHAGGGNGAQRDAWKQLRKSPQKPNSANSPYVRNVLCQTEPSRRRAEIVLGRPLRLACCGHFD